MLFHDLETPRLLLRNISDEDLEFVYKQFSDPVVCRYLYDEEPFTDVNQAKELIGYFSRPESRAQHRWIIIRKADRAKMGTCGFHCWDKQAGTAQTGYDLREEYWGNGYMLEAMREILRVAKDEMRLQRIDAVIYVENVKSSSLALKIGFKRSGTTYEVFRNEKIPHDLYSLDLAES